LLPGDVIVGINQDTIIDIGQVSHLVQAAAGVERVKITRRGLPFLLRHTQ
jgi:hypothetical protein